MTTSNRWLTADGHPGDLPARRGLRRQRRPVAWVRYGFGELGAGFTGMATMPPPHGRDILHFTHLSNLATILADGCLLADSAVDTHLQREVGDRGIKQTRRQLPVTCGPGGRPCDYVPFYFAPKSPMLYKIAVGGVPHYLDGQDPLVYLRSTIGEVADAGLAWVFSNGNCGAHLTEYFDDLDQLDGKVDWPLQSQTMWSATADDPTRATRRAAEFLVHEAMPWVLIRELIVRTEATAELVRPLIGGADHSPPVTVRPEWYYNGRKYL